MAPSIHPCNGNGLLDVHLTCERAQAVVAAGNARPHHLMGASAWVSFWVRARSDVPDALRLAALGAEGA
jgi:hypothetical protein